MKKFLKTILSLVLVVLFVFPVTAYASESNAMLSVGGQNVSDWYDIDLTEDEMNEILSNNEVSSPVTHSNILIVLYNMAIAASGTTLKIVGKTEGSVGVVKTGFKEVIVQRRKNSSESWSKYTAYYDIYKDSSTCSLAKAITVPKGYQYRVTCVHYAKKSLLKTEKINNTSNIVTIS